MDTIFRNLGNGKTFEPRNFLLNLADKIYLKMCDKNVTLSNLSIYYTWGNIKSHIKTIDLQYQPQHGIMNLNYLMDHILDQKFDIIFNMSSKNMKYD